MINKGYATLICYNSVLSIRITKIETKKIAKPLSGKLINFKVF